MYMCLCVCTYVCVDLTVKDEPLKPIFSSVFFQAERRLESLDVNKNRTLNFDEFCACASPLYRSSSWR